MKRKTILVFLIIIIILGQSWVFGDDECTFIGFEGDKNSKFKYSINFNFGIEQWEDGKPSTNRYQQWILNCYFPDMFAAQPETSCNLKLL
jgi:hypothetical protein